MMSALLIVIVAIIWKTCPVIAWETPRSDPAKDLIKSMQQRFVDKDVICLIDLWNASEAKSSPHVTHQRIWQLPPDQKLEVWTRTTVTERIMSLFVLTPKNKKGTAFHVHRLKKNGRTVFERYMFIPALNKTTKIKGGSKSRLDPRLGGLLNTAWMGLTENFSARTVAIENCKGRPCRWIRVITEDGDRIEVMLEQDENPVIRRAIRFNKKGKAVVIVDINEIGQVEGRNLEISGLITIPMKVKTRFRVVDTRLQDLDKEGPYTLDSFANHARKIAKAKNY
jgi:hypothetical protein